MIKGHGEDIGHDLGRAILNDPDLDEFKNTGALDLFISNLLKGKRSKKCLVLSK